MLEFQQSLLKFIQYMQAKTSSLRWVKFGSSLCISGSGKNRILSEPPRCFMTIKMMPKDGVATAQIVHHFVCNPAVSLSCGIAWALVPRARRLESTGWAMPRSQFIPVKIHSGLREGVGHTSPSYKVCPRLPVWKG